MKKCAIQRKPTWTAKELLGDLLPALRSREPIDLSVVNLETSVTTNDEFWPRKGVCYRASKENCLDVLATLRVDVLTLANNHTLDFGIKGLIDTLDAIDSASRVGAGRNDLQAFEPKMLPTPRYLDCVLKTQEYRFRGRLEGTPRVWLSF